MALDGSFAVISDLQQGDAVLGPDGGVISIKSKVKHCASHHGKPWQVRTLVAGSASLTVTTTHGVVTEYAVKSAGDLRLGERVQTTEGLCELTEIQVSECVEVYELAFDPHSPVAAWSRPPPAILTVGQCDKMVGKGRTRRSGMNKRLQQHKPVSETASVDSMVTYDSFR